MLVYDVMTEQEATEERFQLFKEGIYDAVVGTAEDRMSSTGNAMMDITLHVYDSNGKTKDVRDFLVLTKSMMWKVIHFADSAGLLKEYEDGKLCSDVALGKNIQVKIVIEQGKEIPLDKLNGKAPGSRYSDKNKVEDYIKKADQQKIELQKTVEQLDDPIPF